MNIKDNSIPELIVKKLRKSISKEEEEILNDWINASPENRRIYNEITDEESLAKSLHRYYNYSVENAWKKIASRISKPQVKARQLSRQLLTYATILIALMITLSVIIKLNKGKQNEIHTRSLTETGFTPGTQTALLTLSEGEQVELGNLPGKSKKVKLTGANYALDTSNTLVYECIESPYKKVKYNTLETPVGGEYKVQLPDGTKVWLNAASKIVYPEVFNDSIRHVIVSGEAYFEVAHNREKPFVVSSGNYDIIVLGTTFNIASYTNDDHSAITLVEGKVKIKTNNPNEVVYLNPGQQAEYSVINADISVSEVDVKQYTAWKDGMFVFRNETLESIMKKLSRWYDCEFHFDTKEIKAILFTGSLDRYQQLDKILYIISQSCSLEFVVIDSHTVQVKS